MNQEITAAKAPTPEQPRQTRSPARPWWVTHFTKILSILITTAGLTGGVSWFLHQGIVEQKDALILRLEKELALAREFGPSAENLQRMQESIHDLNKRLSPLALAFPIDELTGHMVVGHNIGTTTRMGLMIIEAQDLIEKNKLDLAKKKADEIEKLFPTMAGYLLVRYEIAKKQGEPDSIYRTAEALSLRLPSDGRLMSVYSDYFSHLIVRGDKDKAEKLGLHVFTLDPTNEVLKAVFKRNFGYEPSLPSQ